MTKKILTNKPAICHSDKPVHGHGLCKSCYQKKYRHENREEVNDYRRKNYKRLYEKNKEKILSQVKRYRENNPLAVKNTALKKTFGITLDFYNELLERQLGVCAVCKEPPKKKNLAVDHCHDSNTIRGLLCSNCNTALGLLQDSPEIIQNLLNYLEGENNGR